MHVVKGKEEVHRIHSGQRTVQNNHPFGRENIKLVFFCCFAPESKTQNIHG